ncbi:MAG: dNTP triphosphohydrolase, partial [Victivallaceae bacterium]|nr:dNTP triphosphohydrolase [Victivallaceae bacterium]
MSTQMMSWRRLLSSRRLCGDAHEVSVERSPFQQDYDRIVFSSAFRRLQDKTQVFPLAETDYVRTRLTHSLEASCIGRSLGTSAGVLICANEPELPVHPSDVGAIVAAATLAHDIGNPPLGHAGEESIRNWFENSEVAAKLKPEMSDEECADFLYYEGNAQGFRVLARLLAPDRVGGLRLTCASVGALAKYPCGSALKRRAHGIAGHKFNFFQADRDLFKSAADETGMISDGAYIWRRHPLAFLVEAADDIAYRIVDFEDGFVVGRVAFEELRKLFLEIIRDDGATEAELEDLPTPNRQVEFLRSRAISSLVNQVAEEFRRHHRALLGGTFDRPLIESIPAAEVLDHVYKRSAESVYTHHRVLEVVAAGFELISGMLDIFVPAVTGYAVAIRTGRTPSARHRRLCQLLPAECVCVDDPVWIRSPYLQLLAVLDFISGMSDTSAVNL